MAFLIQVEVPVHRGEPVWAVFGGSLHEDWKALNLPPGKYVVYGPDGEEPDGLPSSYKIVARPLVEAVPAPEPKVKLVKRHR